MSEHTITSMIEGDLFAALLLLEGEVIDLSYDGSSTYRSTNTIDVIGGLNIACIVRGLVGTEWTLTIKEGANEIVSETRTIELGNRDSFAKTVNLPESSGGGSKGGAKKGGSKKGGK